MIHFKNHNTPAFTLVETMLALAVMAMILTPLFVSQSGIFRGVGRGANKIDRMLQAKGFLADSRRQAKDATTFVLEKKVIKPRTTLKYELKEVAGDSPLKKIANVHREVVSMEWLEGNKKYTDTLISFVYKPKKAQP